MEFGYTSGAAAAQKVGCLVAGVVQPRRLSGAAQSANEASAGQLSKLMRAANFDGAAGKSVVLHNVNGVSADRVMLVGLGKGATKERNFKRACATAAASLKACGARSALWCLHETELEQRDLQWKLFQAVKALHDGHHGYTPAPGILPLREAVAADLERTRGVAVHPDHIVCVPGGKVTMFFAILMFGEPGAEIMYPNPGFPIYESVINYSGAKAVPIPLIEEKDFSFDADEVATAADGARASAFQSAARPPQSPG